jgi:hypothetical protein
MTKLTDMQLVLLTTACQRDDGSLLPPPESLGAQAARIRKAVEALIKKGLAAEQAGMAAAQAWRSDGDLIIGVVLTGEGRAIIDPPNETGPKTEKESEYSEPARSTAGMSRPGSKQALVVDLLKQEGGTTLADIVAATGWLPHTSRAALTGLRKKGHAIGREKVDGNTRYEIKAVA